MRRLSSCLAVFCMFCLCFLPAHAESEEYTDSNTIVRNFMNLGIDEYTATKLCEKVENGEILDCDNSRYLDQKPLVIIRKNGFYKEVYEYPDGSRKVVSITAGITQYISGGIYSSGSNMYTWNNATVYGSNGLITISFKANMAGSSYDGHLISVSGLSYSGSQITINSFGVSNANATSGIPANGGAKGICSSGSIALFVYVPINGSPYASFQG